MTADEVQQKYLSLNPCTPGRICYIIKGTIIENGERNNSERIVDRRSAATGKRTTRLTLQDVSDALNIKREYLEALEKDEYDAIPAPSSSRAFFAITAISWNWTASPWPGNTRKTSKNGRRSRKCGPSCPSKRRKSARTAIKRRSSVRENGRKSLSLPASFIFLLLIIWILI